MWHVRWLRRSRRTGLLDGGDTSRALADAVALLESGLAPTTVWELVGLDVNEAGIPHLPSGELAQSVAAAAALARDGGMPLAVVLRRVLAVARQRQEAADARETALAGPRMSARVLAWLPLAGAGLAAVLDPGAIRLVATTPVGWVLLGLAGALTWGGRRWTRRLLARADPPHEAVPVPLALALVDAVLAGGVDVPGALVRVGVGVGGDEGDALAEAGRRLARGADWDAAWGQSHKMPQTLAGAVCRALRSAHFAGASAAPSLRTAIDEELRQERRGAQRAAAELSVTLTFPLTLCLLPAFILIGVVPLIAAVVVSVDLGSLT